ncbi:hypothetical protein C5167_040901 [Papaver somniferum]|uniref:Tyrosinase copper-binding domain-containing protein n=1 Tax=Papaver somniferum TaxID=3469 RepID=A0A4Y7IKI8_PAPSO|nr:polyphenol oxidase, chloroplastic-like [Papaver somniferum]RZC47958.1 hypothetical protein C5167_040901 [Papaver somniferum]
MASLSSFNSISAASTRSLTSTHSSSEKKTQISVVSKPKHVSLKAIECRANKDRDHDNQEKNETSSLIDRRNMLLGLGGLYGATSTAGFGADRMAMAAPIAPPDLSKCGPANLPDGALPVNCCPPPNTEIIDFQVPSQTTPLRIRPAAHLVDEAYIEKYNRAYELMRALPDDDPRSFKQQANVHCAYCDGAYDQAGFPNLDIQVHGSWLFFPFHRYYLYFHEKILGSLIDDPTFALPFWNWDSPAGMGMPSMYAQPGSSLYDELRDAVHQPPYLLDLNYNTVDLNLPARQVYNRNLTTMYRQMVSGARTATLFLGSPYRAGDVAQPAGGTLENVPHGPVHIWTGDRTQPNFENMGNFYSAARDPIFFAHHSNCDRMWTVWKSLGGNRRDFTDPDFLNAAFLFYNEKKQLVRVTIKDCLKQENLRYQYQDVEIPWLQTRPRIPTARNVNKINIAKKKSGGGTEFPIILDKTVRVLVKRPKKKSRSKKEKEDKEEILVISGIELDKSALVKFDVFINDEDEVGPESSEFVGSFTNVPHRHGKKGKKIKTGLKLGITDILEDLDAENDDDVLVTIIPRDSGRGKEVVTIEGIEIQFD